MRNRKCKQKLKAVKHVRVHLIKGPYDGHIIQMSIGQLDTLEFKVVGWGYGCYHRSHGGTYCKTATWEDAQ